MVKSVKVGFDKLKQVVSFGIAPCFMDILWQLLQKSDFYVLSYGRSLSNTTQNCQNGHILIRFFDPVDSKVKVWYLDSRFVCHLTDQDSFKQYSKVKLELEISTKDLKQLEMSYNEQEMTWIELQRARNDLKQPTTTKTQPETT